MPWFDDLLGRFLSDEEILGLGLPTDLGPFPAEEVARDAGIGLFSPPADVPSIMNTSLGRGGAVPIDFNAGGSPTLDGPDRPTPGLLYDTSTGRLLHDTDPAASPITNNPFGVPGGTGPGSIRLSAPSSGGAGGAGVGISISSGDTPRALGVERLSVAQPSRYRFGGGGGAPPSFSPMPVSLPQAPMPVGLERTMDSAPRENFPEATRRDRRGLARLLGG